MNRRTMILLGNTRDFHFEKPLVEALTVALEAMEDPETAAVRA